MFFAIIAEENREQRTPLDRIMYIVRQRRLYSFLFLVLLIQVELFQVHNAVNVRSFLQRGVRVDNHFPSFLEMSEAEKVDLLLEQWRVVKEGFQSLGVAEMIRKNAEEDAVAIGNISLANGEKNDEESDKTTTAVCDCMANELLFKITNGVIPYQPNSCSSWRPGAIILKKHVKRHKKCYKFDAGHDAVTSLTSLHYKRSSGEWFWTPHQPRHHPKYHKRWFKDPKIWMRTNTLSVKPGLLWVLQNLRMKNIDRENKYLIKLLEDFPPKKGFNVVPDGSNQDADAKYNLELCRKRNEVISAEAMCRVKRSGCMRRIISRYFQYADMKTHALAKFKDDHRRLLDYLGFGLDMLGLLEPIGFVFDLLSSGLSFIRRKWIEGVLSLFCAIPGVGLTIFPLKRMEVTVGPLGKALGIILDGSRSFFDEVARMAKRGIQHAKKWFMKTLNSFEIIGKVIKALVKAKSIFIKAINKGVKTFVSKPNRNIISATISSAVKNLKKHTEKLMKLMCSTRSKIFKPYLIIGGFGTLMEFTNIPLVKGSGEWMVAYSPCLAFQCSKELEDFYQCAVQFGFESFKKTLLYVEPKLLDTFGAHTNNLFSTLKHELEREENDGDDTSAVDVSKDDVQLIKSFKDVNKCNADTALHSGQEEAEEGVFK